MKETLAIVIPVYDEEENIQDLYDQWRQLIDQNSLAAELIFINDGSNDNSLKLLKSFSGPVHIINQSNSGHGPAILNGYNVALGKNIDWVFQCDSDNQIPINEFLNLWRIRNESDFIFGIRKNRKDPFYRKMYSLLCKYFIQIIFNTQLSDPNCPFRLMKSQRLKEVIPHIPQHTFAPNLLISIFANKFSSNSHLEVIHLVRSHGKSSLNIMNLMKIAMKCVKEIFLFKKEIYEKI